MTRVRRKKHRRQRAWRRWLLPGLAVLVILGSLVAAYVMWMSMTVDTRLATLQWELPGRVYAGATDLFAGAPLTAEQVEHRLRQSGYQAHVPIEMPGDFTRGRDALLVHLRKFDYWDGAQPSRVVRVTFDAGRVAAMTSVPDGSDIPLLRIDPPLIGRLVPPSNENRVFVPRDEIPHGLAHGIVATEDRHFLEHGGIDIRGILRALWVNLRAGEIEQGGSTLTQQLVKNLFLSPERSLTRKINEAVMALLLERRMTKDRILWAYVNEVYLGQQGATALHGFGTAAEYYFGRPLGELRVHQLALLVALVRGASLYNPHRHPERALLRRNLVLSKMAEAGFIDPGKSAELQRLPLDVVARPRWSRERYPAYMDLVRSELRTTFPRSDLASAGWRIFTALDVDAQEAAMAATASVLEGIEKSRRLAPGSLQSAGLVVDHASGEILAVTGGRDAETGGFNRAQTAHRPIGSLVKPFVYVTALSDPGRYNLLTLIDDGPVTLKQSRGRTWTPENYDRRSHGMVTVMEALSRSYNLATVRLGMEVGVDSVAGALAAAGLESPPPPLPSLLLGAVDPTPREVTQIYQTLANGGFRIDLTTIREAVSAQGRGLLRRELTVNKVFEPAAAFLVTHAMIEATTSGTGRALGGLLRRQGRFPGKTGTTNDLRDSWFAGFGDRLLGVFWVGRDDNGPTGLTGATGAMPIWAAAMARIGAGPQAGPAPAAIAWKPAQYVPMEGRCRDLGAIPYIVSNDMAVPTCADR